MLLRTALFFVLVACVNADTFYDVLRVPSTASLREIKRAYRRLALESHPDKVDEEDRDEATAAFARVVQAYETLSDESARGVYDSLSTEEQAAGASDGTGTARGTHPPPRNYAEDVLHMRLRFGNGYFELFQRRRAPKQSETVHVLASFSLDDVWTGASANVSVPRSRTCPACGGTGAAGPEHIHECSVCGGCGFRPYLRADPASGLLQWVNSTCDACAGHGHVTSEPCPVCGGHRVISETVSLRVEFPPGFDDGSRVELEGEGNSAPQHTTSAAVVTARVAVPEGLSRDGAHLSAPVRVTLLESLLGFVRRVPVGAGREAFVVSQRSVGTGTTLVVAGAGLPVLGNDTQRGDLVAHVHVEYPTRLSARARARLAEVLGEEEMDVLNDILLMHSALAAAKDGASCATERAHGSFFSILRGAEAQCAAVALRYLAR